MRTAPGAALDSTVTFVRFGIQHAMGDPAWVPAILAPEALRRFARCAEDGGWDALAFTDHPAPSTRWVASGGEGVADPFSSLGFCAALTDRIRLLTWVLVASYRNPLLAAHQIATLDAISGGRVTLGLGTGYLKSEFHAVGADPNVRREQFDEALAVMKMAWTGADVSVDGRGFSARGVTVQPPVVQQPHPPLWIHGNGPWGIERAARMGQGWVAMMTNEVRERTIRTLPIRDLDTLARRVGELRTAMLRFDRDPDDIEVILSGHWPILDVRVGWDTAARLEEVARLEALGVDWLVMTVCGDDPGAAEETVSAFAEQVVRPAQ